jgi:16S rRNA (uracil1498-N3)-methyltransferase
MASLAEGARPFREVIAELPDGVDELDVLIGPEGDFSAGETTAAVESGFQPVTLGVITLRVETAVLFCLSVLGYELK